MVTIGPYVIYTTDKALALEAAAELNRRAEKKALPHQGYVVVEGKRLTYELRYPPEQARVM